MKKIFFIIVIFIYYFAINSYAKYNYVYNFKAFSLTRDTSKIDYEIIKTQYSSQNVRLTINFNKPVESIVGFESSNNGRTLTRSITRNETNTIIVKDYSGNSRELSYFINSL